MIIGDSALDSAYDPITEFAPVQIHSPSQRMEGEERGRKVHALLATLPAKRRTRRMPEYFAASGAHSPLSNSEVLERLDLLSVVLVHVASSDFGT